ncbi:hypothetical protein BCR36DRAFT_579112 [Piromyces finnis]|uniref:MADS-box domain-containing protein n=1 Tax=Piromyces finnis TaxID=1754191 RepID=A0A1Y1VPH3_9FUNG|nr:hypothetical protein BCR36DRAFT_579112 [Piromyces finnis]|eukprot:ORX61043.1 hypothetical protein BCR36DRAFT_579112 [Piromyces finnis]
MSTINRADYDQQNLRVPTKGQYKQEDIDDSDIEESPKEKRTGRRKIKIEYIDDKSRRHITFSKRKAGIMKKAYELSTLTGTQVLLLVASETGHVYTFATTKLQPLITKTEGKTLIQSCLNAPDVATDNMNYPQHSNSNGSAQSSPIYQPSPVTAAIPSPQNNIIKNNNVQESSPQSMSSQKVTLQSQIYNEDNQRAQTPKSTPTTQTSANSERTSEIFNDERKLFQQPSYNSTTTPTMQYNNHLSPLQNPNFSPQSYHQTPQQQPTTPNNHIASNPISVNSPYMYPYSSTNVQTSGYQSTYGNVVSSATGYFTPTSMSSPQTNSRNQLPQAQSIQQTNPLIMPSLRQQPTPPQYSNSSQSHPSQYSNSSQSHPPPTQRASRRVHPYQRSPNSQTAPPTPRSSH